MASNIPRATAAAAGKAPPAAKAKSTQTAALAPPAESQQTARKLQQLKERIEVLTAEKNSAQAATAAARDAVAEADAARLRALAELGAQLAAATAKAEQQLDAREQAEGAQRQAREELGAEREALEALTTQLDEAKGVLGAAQREAAEAKAALAAARAECTRLAGEVSVTQEAGALRKRHADDVQAMQQQLKSARLECDTARQQMRRSAKHPPSWVRSSSVAQYFCSSVTWRLER